MKLFFLVMMMAIYSLSMAQDYRDPFEGEYACHRKRYLNGDIYYFNEIVQVYKNIDSNVYINIMGHNLNGYNPYILDSNGSFHHGTFINLLYGGFYPNDSLYLYTWGFSQQNYYNEYYCRKIPLSTYEEEFQNIIVYYNAVIQCLVVLPEGTGDYDLLVTDMTGRTILREKISGSAQKNMTSFPAGVYAITMGREGKYMTRKIVKMN